MPFTPDNSFIIRSREYGDGSEFNNNDHDIIPGHYVRRLWRKPAFPNVQGGWKVLFVNKSSDSQERSVVFSTIDNGNTFSVMKGDGGASLIMQVKWEGLTLRAMERSSVTIDSRTTSVRNFLKSSSNLFHSSQSRTFLGPDGLEYKWKIIYCGHNPAYPDSRYLELHTKDSKVPVATSERLTSRDGAYQDEAHPIYIADRGLMMTSWIIATYALVEKLLNGSENTGIF